MDPEHTHRDRRPQAERARIHAALGDQTRLAIVDALAHCDRRPGELAGGLGIGTNLLAHHVRVLVEAGLVVRTTSRADARGTYLHLRSDVLASLIVPPIIRARRVLFVCTRNSARSQIAAAAWKVHSDLPAESAGVDPAPRIHPLAVRTATRHGLSLGRARPRSYAEVGHHPDLVISVCDHAREHLPPFEAHLLHWSVPDPVEAGDAAAFEEAYQEIAGRVELLAGAVYRAKRPRGRTRPGRSPRR